METILVPVTAGAVVVIIIDLLRKFVPSLQDNYLKLATILVSGLMSILVLLAQTNPTIGTALENALIVLGSSQALYNLVWKESGAHKSLIDEEPQG